jgi:hypothetical protein
MIATSVSRPTAVRRRTQLVRRPVRRKPLRDTTITDSWPPRLNTAI